MKAIRSTAVVPSKCSTVTFADADAWALVTFRCRTLRTTPEPGEATTVVVVAVVIAAFDRPSVTVDPLRSPHDA